MDSPNPQYIPPTCPPSADIGGQPEAPTLSLAAQSEEVHAALHTETWEKVDRAVLAFEQAWQSGQPPVIEEFLSTAGSEREELLVELLHVDLERRWRCGQPARIEDYLERFREFACDPTRVIGLIEAEFRLRRQREPGCTAAEYLKRFPLFHSQLLARLPESLGQQSNQMVGAKAQPSLMPPAVSTVRVPGYEIEEELGRGGMGIVYRARQQGLNRVVAIKMILPANYGGDEERDRFLAEAEAIARLQHPHIVQIHEIGDNNGTPFFSLEFCPGGSLGKRLGGTPLPPREAAPLLEILARAIHAAHQVQVVHRDLKPDNILLTADGIPKVTDFGLAKKLDQPGKTQAGQIMGTPSYMPPEQARGEQNLGPPADIYSLAAILYELLTGRPPFRAATAWDTLVQVVSQDPVPPRQLQPQVPRDLETICLKGLQKDPARRYATALELAEDLQRFQRHQPIRARPVSTLERALKWTRRQPALTALIAASFLVLVLGMFGGLTYNLYTAQKLRVQAREFERERTIERDVRASVVAEAAGENALAQGNREEAVKQFELVFSHCQAALGVLNADPGSNDEMVAVELHDRRDRVQKHLRDHANRQQLRAEMAPFAEDVAEIVRRDSSFPGQDSGANREIILQKSPLALARLKLNTSGTAEEIRQTLAACKTLCEPSQFEQLVQGCYGILLVWAEAESTRPTLSPTERAGRALWLLGLATAVGEVHGQPPTRAFHVRRAHYLARAGRKKEAQAEEEKARALTPQTALDHFLIALDSYRLGKLEQTIRSCEKALEQQTTHFWARYLLALCYLRSAQTANSRERANLRAQARAGLTVCVDLQPTFPWSRMLLATTLTQLGEYDAAEENFAQALKHSKDLVDRYGILSNRGALRVKEKRWEAALADLQEAIRLRPGSAEAYVNLAELHWERNQWKEARAALDQAIQRQPKDSVLYFTRARVHLALKDGRSAQRDLEQTIASEPQDSKSRYVAEARVQLGSIKHQAGKYAEALADLDVALKIDPQNPSGLRQRAETLLALRMYEEVGKTLDACLKIDKSTAQLYKARALIHSKFGEHAQALEMYNRALQLDNDREILHLRAWVYLQLNSMKLALADFEAVLKQKPTHSNALCGRGYIRAVQGQLSEALQDAEDAVTHGPKDGIEAARVLVSAACIHARVALQRHAPHDAMRAHALLLSLEEKEALSLLELAFRQAPVDERRTLWQERVQKDADFVGLRRTVKMSQLERLYGR